MDSTDTEITELKAQLAAEAERRRALREDPRVPDQMTSQWGRTLQEHPPTSTRRRHDGPQL